MSPQELRALFQLTPKTHWGEALLPSAKAFLPMTGSSHRSFDARDGQIHGFPATAPLPSQTRVKPGQTLLPWVHRHLHGGFIWLLLLRTPLESRATLAAFLPLQRGNGRFGLRLPEIPPRRGQGT